MPIVADTHTHTLACGHAYSTLYENICAASKKGLSFLCTTEHGSSMYDAPADSYFYNLPHAVPDIVEGVIVLKGAEVNIVSYEGALDLSDRALGRLDWVIASYHTTTCEPKTVKEHTAGWLAVASNPLVDVMGHMGDPRYPFEKAQVLEACAKHGKIVEINSHSFKGRPGSEPHCREIVALCKELEISVVVSSDAHFLNRIGDVEQSLALLREFSFPEERILNMDYDRFLAVAREKAGRDFGIE